jgi:hypothetical protein
MQSKDSTADSRMRFVPVPPRQIGLRSCPGCSLGSVRSRGKTLVFPQLRQFLKLQLFCKMSFCMEKNFLLIIFVIICQKLQILLLFLSLTKVIRAACYLRTCQHPPISSELPSSGSTAAVSSPFQRPYNSPYTFLRHGPHSFIILVVSRRRSSPAA